jgi:hypothetical protein
MPQTLDIAFFTMEKEFPNSGQGMSMGGSYEYRIKPNAPDQIKYNLTVKGMKYVWTEQSGTPFTKTFLRTDSPSGQNILFLEDFFIFHKLHTPFNFIHPIDGTLSVRFVEPLKIPVALPGGNGYLPDFTIKLITQP